MKDEAGYACDSCGEEIVLPIDLSAGAEQEYVQDCLLCCCPTLIHVETYKGLPTTLVCDFLNREQSRSHYARGVGFRFFAAPVKVKNRNTFPARASGLVEEFV
jgi:hypothetical protein